jgi:hypothetical protein
LARAKHTDRTEARRRYRVEQAARFAEADDVDAEAAPTSKPKKSAPTPASAAPARPNITRALRASFTPLDLRGDLRAFPRVVTHWSFLAAVGLAIASGILFVFLYNPLVAGIQPTDSEKLAELVRSNQLPYLLFQFFAYPPPIAGAFLLGFTARRASWLGGLLLGVIAAIVFTAVAYQPAGIVLIGNAAPSYAWQYAFTFSPIGAMLFASAAAWYKRFLSLANPNRNAPRTRQGGAKGRARQATARR